MDRRLLQGILQVPPRDRKRHDHESQKQRDSRRRKELLGMHEDGSLSDLSGMGLGDEDGLGGTATGNHSGKNRIHPGKDNGSFDNTSSRGRRGRGGADNSNDNEAGRHTAINNEDHATSSGKDG